MGAFTRAATASRGRRGRVAVAGLALIGTSALILSGCSSSSGGGNGGKSSDLTLNIGTILPQTGTLAVLGPPEISAVNLAAKDINAAKAGLKLNVTQKDSGDTSTDLATQSVTSLLGSGVSAIIGAASSSVSLSVIDQISQAGVVQVSGANTSPKFSTYADDGYYFRTAPSDVLQGKVLADKIVKDGPLSVAIMYDNNDYGIGLNDNISKELKAQGATVAADVTFDEGATDFSSAVTQALAPNPEALVIISYDEIKSISEQLASRNFDFKKLYGVDGNYGVITDKDTNVAITGAQFTNPGVQADADFQSQLQAQTKADGGQPLAVFSYAPESYDATVLVSLAALQAGKTDGASIRDNMQKVSEGGTKCKTFADCAKLINDGKDIDYEGKSGPITFDKNGDPSQAYVSVYKYVAGNKTEYESSVYGDLTKK